MKDNLARKQDEMGIVDLWDEDVELVPEEEWPTLDEPMAEDPDLDLTDDVPVQFEDCVMLPRDPAPDPSRFVLEPLPLETHRAALQADASDSVQAAIMSRFPGREVAVAFDAAAAILKARHDLVAYETHGADPPREALEGLLANEPPQACPVLYREWRNALSQLQD